MVSVKINCSKIDKAHLYEGKSGKYLDCFLVPNRDGKDQYDNDGYIAQSVSKEARLAGERGPIIGNWRNVDVPLRNSSAPTAPATASAKPATDDDDVPF